MSSELRSKVTISAFFFFFLFLDTSVNFSPWNHYGQMMFMFNMQEEHTCTRYIPIHEQTDTQKQQQASVTTLIESDESEFSDSIMVLILQKDIPCPHVLDCTLHTH